MSDCCIAYVTVPSREEALLLATSLVEEQLAACGNILPGMTSVYRWEGKVETAEEVVLLLKTTKANLKALTDRVIDLHHYDCPCIVALPIEGGNPAFLAWIDEETRSA